MSEFREARLSKAQILISKGFEPYSENFKVTHSTKYLHDEFSYLKNGEEFDLDVSIAGRVLARRVMGKIAFFSISDQEGSIQLYLEKLIIDSTNSLRSSKHNFLLLLSESMINFSR